MNPDDGWKEWLDRSGLPEDLFEGDGGEPMVKPDMLKAKSRFRENVRLVRRFRVYLIVSILVMTSLAVSFGYSSMKTNSGHKEYADIPVTVDMPDQSQVYLDKAGTLFYADEFLEDRSVVLHGRAFFDVTPSTVPFRVKADNLDIEVLGTQFSVDDISEEQTIVFVQEGSVKVEYDQEFIAILKAGDYVLIDKESGEFDLSTDKANPMAWRSRVFHFQNHKLEEVVFDVSQAYGVPVGIESSEAKKCRYTSTLPIEDLEISELLQLIALPLNMEVIEEGDRYTLIGAGCQG